MKINNYSLIHGLNLFFQDELEEDKATKYIKPNYGFYENMDKDLGFKEPYEDE